MNGPAEECPRCRRPYDDSNRNPMLLRCDHFLCLACTRVAAHCPNCDALVNVVYEEEDDDDEQVAAVAVVPTAAGQGNVETAPPQAPASAIDDPFSKQRQVPAASITLEDLKNARLPDNNVDWECPVCAALYDNDGRVPMAVDACYATEPNMCIDADADDKIRGIVKGCEHVLCEPCAVAVVSGRRNKHLCPMCRSWIKSFAPHLTLLHDIVSEDGGRYVLHVGQVNRLNVSLDPMALQVMDMPKLKQAIMELNRKVSEGEQKHSIVLSQVATVEHTLRTTQAAAKRDSHTIAEYKAKLAGHGALQNKLLKQEELTRALFEDLLSSRVRCVASGAVSASQLGISVVRDQDPSLGLPFKYVITTAKGERLQYARQHFNVHRSQEELRAALIDRYAAQAREEESIPSAEQFASSYKVADNVVMVKTGTWLHAFLGANMMAESLFDDTHGTDMSTHYVLATPTMLATAQAKHVEEVARLAAVKAAEEAAREKQNVPPFWCHLTTELVPADGCISCMRTGTLCGMCGFHWCEARHCFHGCGALAGECGEDPDFTNYREWASRLLAAIFVNDVEPPVGPERIDMLDQWLLRTQGFTANMRLEPASLKDVLDSVIDLNCMDRPTLRKFCENAVRHLKATRRDRPFTHRPLPTPPSSSSSCVLKECIACMRPCVETLCNKCGQPWCDDPASFCRHACTDPRYVTGFVLSEYGDDGRDTYRSGDASSQTPIWKPSWYTTACRIRGERRHESRLLGDVLRDLVVKMLKENRVLPRDDMPYASVKEIERAVPHERHGIVFRNIWRDLWCWLVARDRPRPESPIPTRIDIRGRFVSGVYDEKGQPTNLASALFNLTPVGEEDEHGFIPTQQGRANFLAAVDDMLSAQPRIGRAMEPAKPSDSLEVIIGDPPLSYVPFPRGSSSNLYRVFTSPPTQQGRANFVAAADQVASAQPRIGRAIEPAQPSDSLDIIVDGLPLGYATFPRGFSSTLHRPFTAPPWFAPLADPGNRHINTPNSSVSGGGPVNIPRNESPWRPVPRPEEFFDGEGAASSAFLPVAGPVFQAPTAAAAAVPRSANVTRPPVPTGRGPPTTGGRAPFETSEKSSDEDDGLGSGAPSRSSRSSREDEVESFFDGTVFHSNDGDVF
jgi:hypothetical protein